MDATILSGLLKQPALSTDQLSSVRSISAIDAAKSKVPEDLSLYTDETVSNLKKLLDSINEKLSKDQQSEVDAMAKAKAEIAARYGFTDIRYQLLKRTRQFSAREYTALLGTYSDHIAIEETKRIEFFEKIEQAIDRHGGRYTVYDTIELQLARKP